MAPSAASRADSMRCNAPRLRPSAVRLRWEASSSSRRIARPARESGSSNRRRAWPRSPSRLKARNLPDTQVWVTQRGGGAPSHIIWREVEARLEILRPAGCGIHLTLSGQRRVPRQIGLGEGVWPVTGALQAGALESGEVTRIQFPPSGPAACPGGTCPRSVRLGCSCHEPGSSHPWS